MRLLTISVFLLFSSLASAQIVFAPSFSYVTEKIESSGAVAEDNMTFLDLRLGYLHSSGLYLGGMYNMTKLSDGTNSYDGFSVGPTLGFSHYSGFYALFTYFLMGEQEVNTTDKLTDGMGPQVDIGWAFPITATFHLGPQISYRSIKYDKIDESGTSSTVDVTRSNIMPAINLWFNF